VVTVFKSQNPAVFLFSVPPNGVPFPVKQHWGVNVPVANGHSPLLAGQAVFLAIAFLRSAAVLNTVEDLALHARDPVAPSKAPPAAYHVSVDPTPPVPAHATSPHHPVEAEVAIPVKDARVAVKSDD